jgi:molybdate transport system ATP-binding protein
MIAGFERTGGRISFLGETWEDGRYFMPPHRRRVGFVFQNPELFAHLDVARNLIYAARRSGQMQEVAPVVRRLGLDPLLDRGVKSLSGGEAQRVALARALLVDPKLLVMDEPLSALDAARRSEIMPYIEALRDEARLPILYVSHALAEVARLANRVLVLGAGKVQAFGLTTEVLGDRAAHSYLGSDEPGSLIDAVFAGQEADGLSRLSFSGGSILVPNFSATIGAKIRLFVQSRDILIARSEPAGLSALNIFAAIVKEVTPLDLGLAEVSLDIKGTALRARITRRSCGALGLKPGATCHAILKTVALTRD